jgi:hypothetical protein
VSDTRTQKLTRQPGPKIGCGVGNPLAPTISVCELAVALIVLADILGRVEKLERLEVVLGGVGAVAFDASLV